MNRKISFLCVISAALFMAVFIFLPLKAEAATAVRKYEEGKVVRLKSPEQEIYIYSLEEDSIVEINYAYNYSGKVHYSFYYNKSFGNNCWNGQITEESGKDFVVLEKGDYFLYMYEAVESSEQATAKVKLTSTPVSAYNKDNYCGDKAQNLPAKKWIKLAQTKRTEYSRWYKITVTDTKKVTIDMPAGYLYYVAFVNPKNGKNYNLSYKDDRTLQTRNRVSPGTYNIVVHYLGTYVTTYPHTTRYGMYYQFRWY